jgi:nicotinate-nucleotide pyrophosphorylase (carboxylating)
MTNAPVPAEADELIEIALKEDVGNGDHSSLSCVPSSAVGKAKLLVKQEGVIAGIELAEKIFKKVDRALVIHKMKQDGDPVIPGDIVFEVEGSSRSILTAERLVLNFMQRMSGIATLTNHYVRAVSGYKVKILDTRKTIPGMRYFDKWAVRIGGGFNHRMGLYDMIMIKDNHVDFCGGIAQAIEAVLHYLNTNNLHLKIEIETRNLDEVQQVLEAGKVDRIMLDNFDYDSLKKAVQLIGKKYETEASGNVTLQTVEGYAACGVDYISVGAITHSATGLDLSLKAMDEG